MGDKATMDAAREQAKATRSFEPIEALDMYDPNVQALWLAFGLWLALTGKVPT